MRPFIAHTVLVVSIVIASSGSLTGQTALACTPGSAPQFGSGWCDFAIPLAFHKGDRLRLRIGGTANRVLVRLLPKGGYPDTPIGVLPQPVAVPSNRFIEIVVPYEAPSIVQISVHGGDRRLWNEFFLGSGNGPATLTSIERVSSEPTEK